MDTKIESLKLREFGNFQTRQPGVWEVLISKIFFNEIIVSRSVIKSGNKSYEQIVL